MDEDVSRAGFRGKRFAAVDFRAQGLLYRAVRLRGVNFKSKAVMLNLSGLEPVHFVVSFLVLRFVHRISETLTTLCQRIMWEFPL